MKLAEISCVVFVVISVLTGAADALAWTTPSGITGTGGSASQDVPEDTAAGDTILTLATTGPVGATFTYTFVDPPADNKLEISTADLNVAAGKSFDYETEKTYVVKIQAVENDGGTMTSGTVSLTLSITNVMDVAPTFQSDQYSATIPDGATAGHTLIQVSATDPETSYGDSLTYSIKAGDSTNMFVFDGNTIKVATGKTIDANTLGGYSLTVQADDTASTPNTDTTTVWVAVKTCSSGSTMVVASGIAAVFSFVLSCL